MIPSGPGEQVGVVVPRPGEQLPAIVGSQIGADPTWSGAFAPAMPLLTAAMLTGGTYHPDVALADGTRVAVVGYDPVLDLDRNQWYVDVTFDLSGRRRTVLAVRPSRSHPVPVRVHRACSGVQSGAAEPMQVAPPRHLSSRSQAPTSRSACPAWDRRRAVRTLC